MKIIDTVWTHANCEKLRNWWEIEGLTMTEISKEFSKIGFRVSRNAVIGKVKRMGLRAAPTKVGLSTEKRRAYMKLAHDKRRSQRVEPPISPTNPPTGKRAVLLKHSKDGQCKAIIGYINGRLEHAVYCGEATPPHRTRDGRLINTSWCPYHQSIYVNEGKR